MRKGITVNVTARIILPFVFLAATVASFICPGRTIYLLLKWSKNIENKLQEARHD